MSCGEALQLLKDLGVGSNPITKHKSNSILDNRLRSVGKPISLK